MDYYNKLEGQMYARVAATFGLPPVLPQEVVEQDLRALATEVKCFFGADVYWDWNLPYCAWNKMCIKPESSAVAKENFLDMVVELGRSR